MATEKKLMLIDTDGGVDDAFAIMVALSDPNTEVLAITCVSGNVKIDQVWYNVHRILDVCDKKHIPVYKGTNETILKASLKTDDYYGEDGLGDAPHDKLDIPKELNYAKHAVKILIKLVNQHPGKITMLALGPLANLALAERMDADFSSKLKVAYIMGGNKYGKGNITPTAEFNFNHDPEAAYIVLECYKCPIKMITWEMTMDTEVDRDWFDSLRNIDNKKGRFLKSITELTWERMKDAETRAKYGAIDNVGWNCCDALAACIAIDESIVTATKDVPCSVVLGDSIARGQMVVDWNNFWAETKTKRSIVMDIDMDKYRSYLTKTVR